MQEETIEGEQIEALFDSPRPKPDLVGPPTGRPATRFTRNGSAAATRKSARERDLAASGFGSLRPAPAG